MTLTERIELDSVTESLKDFWGTLALVLACGSPGLFSHVLARMHIWVDYCVLFVLSLAISMALARRALVQACLRDGLSPGTPSRSQLVTAETRPQKPQRRGAPSQSQFYVALGLGVAWLCLFASRFHGLPEARELSFLGALGLSGAIFTVAAGTYAGQVLASISTRLVLRRRHGIDTVAGAKALGYRFDWLRGWRRVSR
jgi:hypothetical protein